MPRVEASTDTLPDAAPACTLEDRPGDRLPVARASMLAGAVDDRVTLAIAVGDGVTLAREAGAASAVDDWLAAEAAAEERRAVLLAAGRTFSDDDGAVVAAGARASARATEGLVAAVADRRMIGVVGAGAGDSAAARAAMADASGALVVSFSRSATSRGRQRAATGPASPRSLPWVAAGAADGAEAVLVAAAAGAMSAEACEVSGVTSVTRFGTAMACGGSDGSSLRERVNSGRLGSNDGGVSGAAARCSETLLSIGRSRESVGGAASAGIASDSGRSWAGFSDGEERDTWS